MSIDHARPTSTHHAQPGDRSLATKLLVWERRLLDMSRRNKLVHCVESRRGFIALTAPDLPTLYDQLAVKRKPLRFQRPVTREFDPSVYSLLRLMELTGSPIDVAIGDIRTSQPYHELERTLRVMKTKARLAMDEQGQHLLYLAFGFVRWNNGSAINHSPLLQMPVSLSMSSSAQSSPTLQADDGELIVNPTLVHLFNERFHYQLPDYRSSPAAYFASLRADFAQHGWTLVEECRLGVFSFQRMALYRDIKENIDRFSTNPILRQLYAGEAYTPATTEEPASPACHIVNADSTQAEAVELSRCGKSYVLKGPPGTGKSQTICNLIAQGLADGKRILFISQKKAALDVVHQRLIKTGLSRFMLAMHDTTKINKYQLVKELGEALHQRIVSSVPDAEDTAQRVKLLEDKLRRYPQQLHRVHQPLGISLADAFAKVSALTDVPIVAIPLGNVAQMDNTALLTALDKLDSISSAAQTIALWSDFKPQLDYGELSSAIAALEAANVPPNSYAACYEKAFYMAWIGAHLSDAPDVAFFDSAVHATNAALFQAKSERMMYTSRVELQHKLSSQIRSGVMSLTAESAILERECSKKARHLPVRKLFSRIPRLLQTLKPVLLMSPLAVSEFLDVSLFGFDMLIFDEASQLFPEDAIGAMMRSKQAVICGDTLQMPPTNFFNTTDTASEDEDEDDINLPLGDSLLEEALFSLPQTSLLWHYRSEFESLIAFSNSNFYDSRLHTFPQAHLMQADTGVEFIYVKDGVYEDRRNRREAEECVRLLFEHIQEHPLRSLGVIAFSEAQQTEIEELILQERQRRPEFEPFFAEDRDAPFVVKNLETIQGDERDTILFSICYGHAPDGKLRLNFGPLGKPGGERRLNVAVTRARVNIKVVASILPQEIDLNRARSEGARLLRQYLEYARCGGQLRSEIQEPALIDTPFVDTIARFLESEGYSVNTNIGCSECKVDIGVLADDGESYCTGILCDGGGNTAASPQDDAIRRRMLERLGWSIVDCWSVDWARNPAAAQKNLLQNLLDAHSGIPVTPKISDCSVEINYDPEPTASAVSSLHLPPYIPASPDEYTYQTYLQNDYPRLTFDQGAILHYIRTEQPLHMELLYQRMTTHYERQKVTAYVRDTVNKHLQRMLRHHVTMVEEAFCMLKHKQSCPLRQAGARDIDHICLLELGEVMKEIVRTSPGMSRDAVIREAATLLGYTRSSQHIEERLSKALSELESQGHVVSNGTFNQIHLKEQNHD